MTVLQDEMLLYHGSYAKISEINLSLCRRGKDFGKGFYVTNSREQAERFVNLSVRREIRSGQIPDNTVNGYLNVFRLHLTSELKLHYFESANLDWLHFVAANRNRALFADIQSVLSPFDVIGGKIANDRTAQTLQLYVSGGYGQPGSEIADQIAIMTLLPNRLEEQFCFRTDRSVQALEYVESVKYAVR